MTRPLIAFVFSIFFIWANSAAADGPVAETRTLYERGIDLVGTDLAQIFDTTRPACEAACLNTAGCEAFTFNQLSNACFPKRDVTGIIPFEGALSGRVYPTDPAVLAGAEARASELSFLTPSDLASAGGLTRIENQPLRNASRAQQIAWTRALENDRAVDWLAFADTAQVANSRVTSAGLSATVRAYLFSTDETIRRQSVNAMAFALEKRNRGRTMIDALRLAQTLRRARRLHR